MMMKKKEKEKAVGKTDRLAERVIHLTDCYCVATSR